MAQDTALSETEHPPAVGPLLTLSPEDIPDVTQLVTETEEPVDNIFSEKQQRLLTRSLLASWKPPQGISSFMATANVGLFYRADEAPLVPDVLLSVDVPMGRDLREKQNRSYFVWVIGKPPDVAIEIVSNREGGELNERLRRYERMAVSYYVVFDPLRCLSQNLWHAFELRGGRYEPMPLPFRAPRLELGLDLWRGAFEGDTEEWLRWVDLQGNPIPTGEERAAKAEQDVAQERKRAEEERKRAEEAEHQANEIRQQKERLAEKLRSLGVNPDEV